MTTPQQNTDGKNICPCCGANSNELSEIRRRRFIEANAHRIGDNEWTDVHMHLIV